MFGLEGLMFGFAEILSPVNILACFVGVFLGTMVGVLPGLGPTATMSLMLPITLTFDPITGIIILAGVWYGAQYGGSTTSILVNIPGEASSVITSIEGYEMKKKGRAGAALAIVAVGSFIAGTIGIVGLQFFAPFLANAALAFGPPEYLSLMVFSFIILTNISGSSPSKGLIMALIGFWLSTVGIDNITSVHRFTFGSTVVASGIDFLPVAMGLFGITEIILVTIDKVKPQKLGKVRIRDLYPNKNEMKRSVKPIARGSFLGFLVGLVPGPGPTISTFISYSIEKRFAGKYRKEFGKGAVEGVAGPEAANNSAVSGSLIPLLALGIPFAPPAAILLVGLRLHDIEPGPMLFQLNPMVFWAIIASMYLGNVLLVVLNLPLVGIFAKIATLRAQILMPIVSIICIIGVYSVRNSVFDIWVMLLAGAVGYFFKKKNYPIAPLVLGLILGPTTETSFRTSMKILDGNLLLMFGRPISMVLLGITIIFLTYVLFSKTGRRGILHEELKNED